MIPGGLSISYLPPFPIVAGFFITSAFFGLIGAILALYSSVSGGFVLRELVHTYTLGFLGMVMFGALFQMLPVVAGAIIGRPLLKAALLHASLFVGTLTFVFGSIYLGNVLAGGGMGTAAAYMLYKLFTVRAHDPTPYGMRFALFFLLVGTAVGTIGVFAPGNYLYVIELHVALMLIGWVLLLIASVSFRVIEMFFVTPPYPKTFGKAFPWLVGVGILLNALSGFHYITKALLSVLALSFAFLTLDRLARRKRKLPDPLVRLWQVGMVSCTISALLYPFNEVFILFLFFFGTFAQSVVMAMMYRIIPFLVWIHLSNKGIRDAPTMHEVIRPSRTLKHLYLHLLCVVSFLVSFFTDVPALWVGTALLYCFSFGTLFFNISWGVRTYFVYAFPQR
ncbi:MAG TPA: hypothetical protein EYH49_01900 [Aquifex aeolicus]|nr:hypothetical protein [Aquifex aeolicus]